MTSSIPVPNPTWDTAADTFLVNSRATSDWCHKTREAGATDDPIVQELETVLWEGRRRESWLADPLSLRQSYVVDRILRGDAYYTTSTRAVTGVSQMPRHALKSFLDDERTVANLNTLTGAGVPLVVLHLALYSELKQRTEFDVPAESRPRTMALIDSLSRVTGVPVYSTLEHVQFPIDNLESLSVHFLVDDHPSLRGHQFFAEMVGQVLLRYGYVR